MFGLSRQQDTTAQQKAKCDGVLASCVYIAGVKLFQRRLIIRRGIPQVAQQFHSEEEGIPWHTALVNAY